MPIPYPYEAAAGRVSAKQKAGELYGQVVWMARLSDEMSVEPEVNIKKAGQLVGHCAAFRRTFDDLKQQRGGARSAVAAFFRDHDIEWPSKDAMTNDFQVLYNSAAKLIEYIEADYPEVNSAWVSMGFDENKRQVETEVKKPKTDDFAARINDFRALFDVKG